MLKQTINDAKPKTHNTEEKYLRQNVKRTSLPPIFELKPILANYIGQSSDLLQQQRQSKNILTFNDMFPINSRQANSQKTVQDCITYLEPKRPTNSPNIPNYILERENLVGMKSHAMAATEDNNFLLYAFATEYDPMSKNSKLKIKKKRGKNPNFGNIISLIYFNKSNGAYRKKQCIRLPQQKVTCLQFVRCSLSQQSPQKDYICLFIGTWEGSLMKIEFGKQNQKYPTKYQFCDTYHNITNHNNMGMTTQLIKLGVYAVQQILELPKTAYDNKGMVKTMAVLCQDDTIFIVTINSPISILKKLTNILLQPMDLRLTKSYFKQESIQQEKQCNKQKSIKQNKTHPISKKKHAKKEIEKRGHKNNKVKINKEKNKQRKQQKQPFFVSSESQEEQDCAQIQKDQIRILKKMDLCYMDEGRILLVQCNRRGGVSFWDPYVSQFQNNRNMKEFEVSNKSKVNNTKVVDLQQNVILTKEKEIVSVDEVDNDSSKKKEDNGRNDEDSILTNTQEKKEELQNFGEILQCQSDIIRKNNQSTKEMLCRQRKLDQNQQYLVLIRQKKAQPQKINRQSNGNPVSIFQNGDQLQEQLEGNNQFANFPQKRNKNQSKNALKEHQEKNKKIISRYSLIPFCQIHSLFPQNPIWISFYGAVLVALFSDGRIIFVATDLTQHISEHYQIVSATKLLSSSAKQTIKCIKLVSHTLFIGKQMNRSGKCVIQKYSIDPKDYSLTHRLSILVSQLNQIRNMFISNDFSFMLCRTDNSFMVCFQEQVFRPIGLGIAHKKCRM